MVMTMKSALVNMGFAVALLLGSAAALTIAPSAEARSSNNVQPFQNGHQIGFGSRFMERRADVVFDRELWTRAGSGYTFSFDVTNRGNLVATGVNIYVVIPASRVYGIDVGRLNVGESKRYAVWLSPEEVSAGHTGWIDLFDDGTLGISDTITLRPPAVRDHRT